MSAVILAFPELDAQHAAIRRAKGFGYRSTFAIAQMVANAKHYVMQGMSVDEAVTRAVPKRSARMGDMRA